MSTPAAEPLRTCVGCRRVRRRSELVRLALTGDPPRVTLDLAGRLPGRGAYLCRESGITCLQKARRRHALARSLRVGNDVIHDWDEPVLATRLQALVTEVSP